MRASATLTLQILSNPIHAPKKYFRRKPEGMFPNGQCCASGSRSAGIFKQSMGASASTKNPDQHPNQSDELDPEPDPHHFADDKPKCIEYKPI
jgi:hypothetical protein